MSRSRALRLGLLFALSLTEVMPVMFLMQVVPVLIRKHGASLERLGSHSLLMLPWTLKFLWAPWLDRIQLRARGHYRSWLLLLHPLELALVCVLALPQCEGLIVAGSPLALSLLLGLSTIAATGDIAVHGLAVHLLRPEERGSGNAVQIVGMLIGYMLGGGLLLVSLEHFGWTLSVLATAAVVLTPLVAVWFYEEPVIERKRPPTLGDALRFLRLPGSARWLGVVALIALSYSLANTPLYAALSDRGFALSEIGMMTGVLGSVTGIAASIAAAAAVQRWGRRGSFYWSSGACALALASLSVLSITWMPRWAIYASVGSVMAGWMAVGTVKSVMMMDRARPALAGSDFTIQHSVGRLGGIVGGSVGGFLAAELGVQTMFVLTPLCMLAAIGISARLLGAADFRVPQQHT